MRFPGFDEDSDLERLAGTNPPPSPVYDAPVTPEDEEEEEDLPEEEK